MKAEVHNNKRGIPPVRRIIISIFLLSHIILVIVGGGAWWFVLFFLYGGIQALVMLCLMNTFAIGEISIFKQRSMYLFSLMEGVYTISMLFVIAYGYYGQTLTCLRNTIFTNPEFFFVAYSIPANILYFSAIFIWRIAPILRKFFRKPRV